MTPLRIVVVVMVVILARFVRFVTGQNILAIGDSLDRFMVEDFCASHGPSKKGMCGGWECTYWADGILKPGEFPTNSMRCEISPNVSVSQVGVYGSPDSGPYYEPKTYYNTDTWHYNTKERIHAVIDGYFSRVGVPDLVLFHSVLWDISLLYLRNGGPWDWRANEFPQRGDYAIFNSSMYNAACKNFESQMRRRIADMETALARNLNLTSKMTIASNTTTTTNNNNSTSLSPSTSNLQRLTQTTVNARNQIRARIGLRAAIYNSEGGVLIRGFNQVMRRLASEMRLTYYDYDYDVWSKVNYDIGKEKQLLRDRIHPNQEICRSAALKLLRQVYSKALVKPVGCSSSSFISNNNTSAVDNKPPLSPCDSFPDVWWPGTGKPRPAAGVTRVLLLQQQEQEKEQELEGKEIRPSESEIIEHEREKDKGSIFFFPIPFLNDNAIKERLHGVSSSLLRINRLTSADALCLLPHQLATIPLGPPIPRSFFQPEVKTLVNTSSGSLWLVQDGERRLIPPSAVQYYNISFGHEKSWERQRLDARMEDAFLTELVPRIGSAIPDIYNEGTLMRFVGSREVFALLGGRLHSVPSANVFFKNGWEFSSVKVVVSQRDMDVIPFGEPLPDVK